MDSLWGELPKVPDVEPPEHVKVLRARNAEIASLKARLAECEVAVDQAVALGEYLEGHSKGTMAERVKTALSTPFAVERATELTRLRAVEAAANRVCDEADATGTPGWPSVQKLAEACGRKG